MPPKEKKERQSNFKSWETQSRLLSALVASLDNPRIDYKSKLVLFSFPLCVPIFSSLVASVGEAGLT